MPIYEFYCLHCHTVYSFLSRRINPTGRPKCPGCGRDSLEKQVSLFTHTGRAREDAGEDDLPIDESRMERAMSALASEAESLDEENPQQAAALLRKFSGMTGLELGPGMQEAIKRMEEGEDPEDIEQEMGERLEAEDPFIVPGAPPRRAARPRPVHRDQTLYEMD